MEQNVSDRNLNDEDNEDETLELLKSNKHILEENSRLKEELQEYSDVVIELEEEKKRI